MKNILKIFKSDLKGLFTNFLALVIAGGLCILPALYAWFNIYANWDPYSNTGNIKIAVVNLDDGIDKDGKHINMGDGIEDSLREKDSIGWQFLDKEEDAVSGVKSGKYYAALVIDKDFSYGLYNGFSDSIDNPKLTYYVNDKKNAVATKITDTAVSTVQSSINKQFIAVVVNQIFTATNGISNDIKNGNKVEELIEKLSAVNETLKGYDSMITKFISANDNLTNETSKANESLEETKKSLDDGVKDIEQKKSDLASTKRSFQIYSSDLSSTMGTIKKTLSSISGEIKKAQLEQDAKTLTTDVKNIVGDVDDVIGSFDKLSTKLERIADVTNSQKIKSTVDTISNIKKTLRNTVKDVDVSKAQAATAAAVTSLTETISSYEDTIKQIREMFDNQVVPQVNDLIDQMSKTLTSVEDLIGSVSNTASGMSDVFDGVGTTLGIMNLSLSELQGIIKKTSDSLTKVLSKLDNANESEQIEILVDFLGGNPKSLGEFFSQPVQVEDNYIYSIENYGSGVTPFYTTLAIWVGMTILVSLIKVHASEKDLTDVKLHQLFFGRYLILFFMSQIQTLIIVLGNLLFFKVQCLHPFAFWGASAMASLTFSLIIYSLTIAFGDIGKAVAVVIMVVQIAGSGGTYPIEALPAFFRGVYFFFPFPYAINAMRECIGGMYENNYFVYLMQLCIFCVAALIIGLVIRIPFIKLNHFIEKRMEDTKML